MIHLTDHDVTESLLYLLQYLLELHAILQLAVTL